MNAPSQKRPAPRPSQALDAAAAIAAAAFVAVLITFAGTVDAAAQPATPTVPVTPTPSTPAPTTTPPRTRWVEPPPSTTTVPTSPTSPVPGDPGSPGSEPDAAECGVSNISGCVDNAIDGFFQRLVESALNPLLDLLSQTLLTTPEPGDLPRVGELWDSSWQAMLAIYGLLVMAAGILLMVRETLQTRYSIQDLAPRIVAGFLAGATSLLIASQAIHFANALATGLAGDGLNPGSAGAALRELATITAVRGLVSPAAGPGIFMLLLELALVVLLVLLLITYVVRVAITIILVVAAPLALMCHVLPGLDAVARWWWRSFAACLAIQVVQSLVLITSLRVFLTPGGWEFFGPNADGLVSLIIGLALIAVLIKVPFWLLSSMRIGPSGGRSMIGSLARGFIAYKTYGLLKGGSSGSGRGTAATPARLSQPRLWQGRPAAPSAPPDPYARVRSTRDGQLMLPLDGVRRGQRQPSPAPPASTTTAPPRPARSPRGRQLAFDFTEPDPYRGIRPGRGGQYPLPIPVRRVRPSPPIPPQPPAARAAPRRRPEQLTFDFAEPAPVDPYARDRPGRGGQYPLPFPVIRVKPAPPPPVTPQPPAPVRSTGRQLHLPMPDLPVRRRAPRAPRGGTRR
ncbi:hypothetical protein HGA13_12150 [Nocardia speluncae]|uniref:TrbL/VirB6 plasmid conjugal transfer protein n=1 Tax=Nocardia speluncae TaxID=419477 RepID=A0A846XJ34_9NOCA|nr:hypothetical protein [Nocardia speluncae]NKY33824.1 hypothetical protein [Nocardia speluncae]